MAYIEFEKDKLINLSYSLNKEILRSNRKGAYSSSTIIFCNTRKYHGLLVTPQPAIDDELHVLLSSIDPTIIQHDAEFNFGIHKYPNGVYAPRGHKYVRELVAEPVPKITYRVGGVILTLEAVFSHETDRILLKYTLVDCHSETKLRLKPFLAFRQRHKLSKANEFANKKYSEAENGVSFKLYQGYTPLYIQMSKENEYIHTPEWYYNIEYQEEQDRGYEFNEDLLVPGFFEVQLKKGESVVVAAGTEEANPKTLTRIFNAEVKKRIPRDSFENCLMNSAQQFIYQRNGKTEIIAGYHWFGRWGRDTFISLPGLTLSTKSYDLAKKILETISQELNGPLFPNNGTKSGGSFNSVDAPLWYFWAIQKFVEETGEAQYAFEKYFPKMVQILEGYKNGTQFNIKMQENGLIWAGVPGMALTWMDAINNGKPVTPRIGMTVEVNALWYNALMFSIDMAEKFGQADFVNNWKPIANMIPGSFKNAFWNKDRGYLADYVTYDYQDWSVRPNMIFAASLPYSPISVKIQQLVVDKVQTDLLTVRGLRTLSPVDENYEGIYEGNQFERDNKYHQGMVWPWLFGHFVEAYLKIHDKSGVRKMQWYLEQFEETIREHGIGTISEIYDGEPPHAPRGAISQAWSVSEVLRAKRLIEKYLNK